MRLITLLFAAIIMVVSVAAPVHAQYVRTYQDDLEMMRYNNYATITETMAYYYAIHEVHRVGPDGIVPQETLDAAESVKKYTKDIFNDVAASPEDWNKVTEEAKERAVSKVDSFYKLRAKHDSPYHDRIVSYVTSLDRHMKNYYRDLHSKYRRLMEKK